MDAKSRLSPALNYDGHNSSDTEGKYTSDLNLVTFNDFQPNQWHNLLDRDFVNM